MRKAITSVMIVTVVFLTAPSAFASPLVFDGNAGNLSAEATFDEIGGDLVVTLANTSLAAVEIPSDVLTGIFFTIPTSLANPISATLAPGSTVYNAPAQDVAGHAITGGTYPDGNVGAEWAFKNDISVAGTGINAGISSSGLGIFGPGDRFDTVGNLDGPTTPDGLGYGILPVGGVAASANTGVTRVPLIDNAVIFEFVMPNFDVNSISNVWFQYGTALSDPRVQDNPVPVPEPASLCLLALGVGGMAFRRFRKSLPF